MCVYSEPMTFTINGLEKKFFNCRLRVDQPGVLKINGIKWSVFGGLRVYQPFVFKGKLIKNNVTEFEANLKNVIEVLPQSGILSIKVLNYEHVIYYGQIRQITFEFANLGTEPIDTIKYANNQHNIFGFHNRDLVNVNLKPGQVIS